MLIIPWLHRLSGLNLSLIGICSYNLRRIHQNKNVLCHIIYTQKRDQHYILRIGWASLSRSTARYKSTSLCRRYAGPWFIISSVLENNPTHNVHDRSPASINSIHLKRISWQLSIIFDTHNTYIECRLHTFEFLLNFLRYAYILT